jgi:hypothetical protein
MGNLRSCIQVWSATALWQKSDTAYLWSQSGRVESNTKFTELRCEPRGHFTFPI